MKNDSKATISNESCSEAVASTSVTGSTKRLSRRGFMQSMGIVGAALGLPRAYAAEKAIPGLEKAPKDLNASKGWKPVSDRKIRVGIVGHGLCQFGAAFGFQDHPNVEVVAVSDLFPDRCADMAKACRCSKTYPSLEEMVKDDKIEAIFLATDAPSHPRHAILALEHGKHVGSCVPAVYGSMEDAENLFQTVKKTGLKYMMFETSSFHEELYAMRQLYKAGALGKIVYAEGEYFHYTEKPLPSYKEWRVGGPPQWYPTHSNAYYIGVTDGSFTDVSCLGIPSRLDCVHQGVVGPNEDCKGGLELVFGGRRRHAHRERLLVRRQHPPRSRRLDPRRTRQRLRQDQGSDDRARRRRRHRRVG